MQETLTCTPGFWHVTALSLNIAILLLDYWFGRNSKTKSASILEWILLSIGAFIVVCWFKLKRKEMRDDGN